jgi:hypothetical protein
MRHRSLRGCLIAFSLCFLAASPALSKQPGWHPPEKLPEHYQDANEKQAPAEPDKRETLETPVVVKTILPEKSPEEAANDARERNDKRWYDSATLITAIATLIILSVQAGVFWVQADRLKQTIEAMKKIATDQSKDMQGWIGVAEKSADAAMKSAEVAELALVGTEAPFIFAIIAFPIIKADEILTKIRDDACYTLRNFGRSPAIVREVYISCDVSCGPMGPVPFPPPQSQLL